MCLVFFLLRHYWWCGRFVPFMYIKWSFFNDIHVFLRRMSTHQQQKKTEKNTDDAMTSVTKAMYARRTNEHTQKIANIKYKDLTQQDDSKRNKRKFDSKIKKKLKRTRRRENVFASTVFAQRDKNDPKQRGMAAARVQIQYLTCILCGCCLSLRCESTYRF